MSDQDRRSELIAKINNGGKALDMPMPQVACPICHYDYVHPYFTECIDGGDNYKADWWGRGDLYKIHFWAECGSEFQLCFGYHKGQTFCFYRITTICRDSGSIDYHEYIQSPEWRKRAEAARVRAGNRCQVCNRHRKEVVLDAHHRTYERLGNELPEDITVLCRDCHSLYETAKKNGNR